MRVALIAVLLCLTACRPTSSPFVEQRQITAGSLNGFSIGMSPSQALPAAKRLGAKFITPTPCAPFIVTGASLSQIPSFHGLEGVRVTDARPGFVDAYFSGGKVSAVVRSPIGQSLPTIPVGDTVEDLREALASNMSADSSLSVAPIVNISEVGALSLEDMSSTAEKMKSHRCWLFELTSVKPAGATYELAFGTAGLETILYRRARIRAD